MSNAAPNDVIAAFRAMNNIMAKAENFGGRGWFPPDGLYDSIIEAMEMEIKQIEVGADNQKRKVNAIFVGFTYRLTEDPDSPGAPRAFVGKTHVLPVDESLYVPAPGKKGNRYSIERDRLCRTLSTITGIDLETLKADVAGFASAAYARINDRTNANPVVVKVKAETRSYKGGDGKDRTDSSEFAVELLSK